MSNETEHQVGKGIQHLLRVEGAEALATCGGVVSWGGR